MPGTAIAPYAQAAAVVNANGSVDRWYGVTNVEKGPLGVYVVEFDSSVDVANSVAIATPLSGASGKSVPILCLVPASGNEIHVHIQEHGKGASDYPFHIIVP
uniref:hypothetical protein n=1 Tax=Streptomyces chartreusis TaxID=1969 RepID=UPI003F4998D2